MSWVPYWDDSFNPVPISRLREMYRAGFRVWGRYVGMGSAAKHWTAAEIGAWFACGPDTGVAILAEADGTEPRDNPSVGDDHAREARNAARALGVPDSTLISPAMDRDVTMADARGPVARYCQLWAAADSGRLPVMYIEPDAGGYLCDHGLSAGTFTPAAYLWDSGKTLITPANAPAHVVMTQEHNGRRMAGGVVDIGHCRTSAPHVWWNPRGPVGSAPVTGDDMTPEEMALFDPNDADKGFRNRPWRADAKANPTVQLRFAVEQTWDDAHTAAVGIAQLRAQVAALTAAVQGAATADQLNAAIASLRADLVAQLPAALVAALPVEGVTAEQMTAACETAVRAVLADAASPDTPAT